MADGLLALARGSDEPHADAAAEIVAETLLMHRAWLESKFKK